MTGVGTKGSAAETMAAQRLPLLRRPERPVHLSVTVVLVLFVLFALPPLMSAYYTGYMTLVAIYSIVTLGLGLLVGRVGLYSLGRAPSCRSAPGRPPGCCSRPPSPSRW